MLRTTRRQHSTGEGREGAHSCYELVMNENHNIFITEDRWKQPVHRVTQSDTKCALRVAGDMELADKLV